MNSPSSQNQAFLSLKQLSCERGYRRLFTDLNLELCHGEVLRITGANGSGKTSLLNILAGLSSQYEGELFFEGKAIAKAQFEFRQAMTYLSHEKGVKLNLTVLENLDWFSRLYPSKQLSDDQRLELLDKVGLKRFRLHRVAELSQGQKQRVALARLLMSEAKLWILDEPFTAIDKEGVANFEAIIDEFALSGGTVIVTTHHALSLQADYRELCLDEFVS